MNNLRVSLKHHGSFPSAADLQQTRKDVAKFLSEATRLVFDVDFNHLDLIDLVTQPETAAALRNADEAADADNHVEALALLNEAFEELLTDYAARKRGHNGGPYDFGPRTFPIHVGPVRSASRLASRDSDLGELVSAVIESGKALQTLTDTTRAIQKELRVIAVGLDYRRYARFSMLLPHIDRMMDGSRHVRPVPGLEVGAEEYEFCRNFVIEASLHLASMDFDLDLVALWCETRAREIAGDL